ncbi:MAG: glycosyltransferase family 39 protein [Bacteroidetes bacterium]|nr:glycosyltransferase family 39 protein [Bacteroidota bacterium]
MITRIRKYWDEQPLILIMVTAVFFRLLSVIFAKGWGMMDDHFLVIESSQSWVDGYDYNAWLPGSPGNHGPTGHNMFYPGIHFLLFSFLNWIHITDSQTKMLIVRFLHGTLSLVTVYLGYKITEKLDSKSSARIAGILLAILWFMPWMSMRNLIEMVCIPFLILGIWFMVKNENPSKPFRVFLLAGLWFGLAFIIRPQSGVFSAGVIIAIMIRKKWKGSIALLIGLVLPFLVTQGGIDFYLWHKPFAEISEYIMYNLSGKDSYVVLPWYNYFLVIWGLLIPPVSLFLFFGFIRSWKKHLILFIPVVLFFIAHSCVPNKQERFILPVIPFFIILGSIGWTEFMSGSKFWQKNRKLLHASWAFFWIINLVLLGFVSTMYSKKARVETMHYLSRYPDIHQIMVADYSNAPELFPCFYCGQWPHIYEELREHENTDSLIIRVSKRPIDEQPRFILFTGDKDLEQRVIKARKYFPSLEYEYTGEPGLIDKVMHWLNPSHNVNRPVYIYRNNFFFPEKK